MVSGKGKWRTSCAGHTQDSWKLRCSVMVLENEMDHTDPVYKLIWVFWLEEKISCLLCVTVQTALHARITCWICLQ